MSADHPVIANPVVRMKDVCAELGMHRRTFERLCARGGGPKVIHLSKRFVGVRRQELERWLAECESEHVPSPQV